MFSAHRDIKYQKDIVPIFRKLILGGNLSTEHILESPRVLKKVMFGLQFSLIKPESLEMEAGHWYVSMFPNFS